MPRLPLLALLLAAPALAEPIPFDGGWREQRLPRLPANAFGQGGDTLQVRSDGAMSLLWRAVPPALRRARTARWGWAVAEGVPATDLRRRGGDDRNLAVYFVWTDDGAAGRIDPGRARRMLADPGARVLAYVWGGADGRGTVRRSPYLPGMRMVILRPAGTGQHLESVDLAADYRRAFGSAPGALVAIGISADSDDTGGRIRASVTAPDLR